MSKSTAISWLVLIHQIPPKPDYLRVKMSRHLARIGAAAIKNTVYVLPRNQRTMEHFQWLAREIKESGGEAMICEATFVEGVSNEQIKGLFHAARNADFESIATESRHVASGLSANGKGAEEVRREATLNHTRLKRRLQEAMALDYFDAPGRKAATQAVEDLECRLRSQGGTTRKAGGKPQLRAEDYKGRTWVTRRGIEEDRIASAWLIRRFIDPKAKFRFIGDDDRVRRGEIRFDMFEAEFTHEGDRCTFETVLHRFKLADSALRAIGRIIHDIDLNDDKFSLPETVGISALIRGIVLTHRTDMARLERGRAMLDDLYAALQ